MRRKTLEHPDMATQDAAERPPKSGDVFHCDGCGMELEIIADCGCERGPRLECCGRPLSRRDDVEEG